MDGTEGQEDRELAELLKELLDDGYILHDVAIGVTKQIIDKGLESLSSGQRDVYERYISPIFENDHKICKRCQQPITDLPLNERYALLDTGYCPLCQYRMEKDD